MYRKKYNIAICEDNKLSLIRWLCESTREFAELLNIKTNVATQTLYNLFNKRTNHVTINGHRYLVEFIKVIK